MCRCIQKCLEIIGYPNPSRAIGGDGYAWNIWFNRQSLGYDAYFDYPSTPQFGDWAVFNKAGDTPDSHVAMFVSDNGNGTSQFFGQNQPQPYCTVTSISTANILGWLRVKPEFGKERTILNQGMVLRTLPMRTESNVPRQCTMLRSKINLCS